MKRTSSVPGHPVACSDIGDVDLKPSALELLFQPCDLGAAFVRIDHATTRARLRSTKAKSALSKISTTLTARSCSTATFFAGGDGGVGWQGPGDRNRGRRTPEGAPWDQSRQLSLLGPKQPSRQRVAQLGFARPGTRPGKGERCRSRGNYDALSLPLEKGDSAARNQGWTP